MKYSVIVPTYNRAAFLPRCLTSVATQDCIDGSQVEIIIIDDGSTDNTKAIVEAMDLSPCKKVYIQMPHTGEPGTARNKGLDIATGDYIAYCDSDDFWLPHHLATASQEFKKDPSLAMVMTYWGFAKFVLLPNGIIKNQYIVPLHPVHCVNTNCRIHKRECVKEVGNFNTSRWGEDQDFFDRITNRMKTKKVVIVTNVNGYIQGGNNLTFEFDPGIKRTFF